MSEINEMQKVSKFEEGSKFEEELTRALRPVNPPETLAKFLAIAAEAEEKRRSSGRWWIWMRPKSGGGILVLPRSPRLPMWMSGAVAAMLLLGAFAGQQVHLRHERVKATHEFETATRITDQAMEHTREQLARAGVRLE